MGKLLIRRREMALQSGDPFQNYVFDDLFLFYDGILNTRHGHDASSANWEDLSGNNRDVAYASAKTIGDYYCIPNAGFSTSFSISKNYTLEFVLDKPQATSQNDCIMCVTKDASNAASYISRDGTVVDAIWFGTSQSPTSFVIPRLDVISTYNSQGYRNGETDAGWVDSGGSWNYPNAKRLFAYSTTGSRICKAKICALRLYTRALTPDEIARNAAVDALRFRPYRP